MKNNELISFLKEGLEGEGLNVSFQNVHKNNGTKEALSVKADVNATSSPLFYIDDLMEMYESGIKPDEILQDVLDFCNPAHHAHFVPENISNFSQLKDKIFYRLVNYEMNKETLKDAPHIRLGDLAVEFRVAVIHNDDGIASARIANAMVYDWEVTKEDVILAANKNTPKLFPAEVINLTDFLKDVIEGFDIPECSIPMYILTNRYRVNGAASILYKDIWDIFNEKGITGDLYVIPSSIHEVLLIRKDDLSDDDLSPMALKSFISEINWSSGAVRREDVLSDNLYYWDAKKKSLRAMDF